MTVGELVALLEKHDPSREVVLAADGEGNYYHKLRDGGAGVFHFGEVFLETLTPELEEMGYTEEDVSVEGVRCLVLSP